MTKILQFFPIICLCEAGISPNFGRWERTLLLSFNPKHNKETAERESFRRRERKAIWWLSFKTGPETRHDWGEKERPRADGGLSQGWVPGGTSRREVARTALWDRTFSVITQRAMGSRLRPGLCFSRAVWPRAGWPNLHVLVCTRGNHTCHLIGSLGESMHM